MIAIDTNLLLRYILRDDKSQFITAQALMSEQGWWISHTVLLEAEWVLRSAYGFEPEAIATVVENLLMGAAIAWQDEGVVERAIALYKSKRMDFADVLHAVQTPKEIKFATFDKRFAKSMKDSKRPVVVAY